MFQVAFYGKGGIGKSTVAANVTYQLSRKGKKVLQVGCDPKHDSTRSLLAGKSQVTVLDYLRDTPAERRKLEDVVLKGSDGIDCVEAGGPEPGVGCAGRGILTMFDFLRANGMNDRDYDFRIYDVLGDVVCGGFAVPMRQEYADAVYIVTSGEFMALYAANNILKGLVNYDDGRPRVAGIILNCRGIPREEAYVRNFADAVGIPIVSVIPRSKEFSEAEAERRTVSEVFPDSEPSRAIETIVLNLLASSEDPGRMYFPKPLDETGMDLVAKGIPVSESNRLSYVRVRTPSDDFHMMSTCAFGGAMAYLTRIRGVHTIVHGNLSCAQMMCNFADTYNIRRSFYDRYESVWDRVSCTGLTDSISVFGGKDILEKKIEERIAAGDEAIFVVSTCVAGMIGDDVDSICAKMSKKHGVVLKSVKADGVVNGDTLAGRSMVIGSILDFAVDYSDKDEHLIDIIGDYRSNDDFTSYMDESVERLLNLAGFELNASFPEWTDLDSIRRLGKAGYAVSASHATFGFVCADEICGRLGIRQMKSPLPRGIGDTIRWLEEVEELTGRDLSDAKSTLMAEYRERISPIAKHTAGKRIVLVVPPAADTRWATDLLSDMGIEVVDCMEDTYSASIFGEEACKGKKPHRREMVEAACRKHDPDAVISNRFTDRVEGVRFIPLGAPKFGLEGTIDYAKRLRHLLEAPVKEEWMD